MDDVGGEECCEGVCGGGCCEVELWVEDDGFVG